MLPAADEKHAVGHAVPRRWPQPRAPYAVVAVARNFVPLVGLIAAAPFLAARSTLAPWLLAPLLGLLLYRLSNVMHDCGHRTLFKTARANDRVGRVLGALTGIDYESFTRLHWRHHLTYGEPQDPQGFHYLDLQKLRPLAWAWHLARPLLGLHLRYALPESALAPRNLQRTLRSGELLLIVVVQGLIIAMVTGGGRYPALALLPAVSGATFGLFFSQLRGIAEHAATDGGSSEGCVRSHAPHWLDRMLLYEVNFNYHAEHHAHPECPSWYLPAVREASTRERELAPSMWRTLSRLFASSRAIARG
jgi:fatty acid desaturase